MKTKTVLATTFLIITILLHAQDTKNWPKELESAMALQAQGNYKEGVYKFNAWCKQQPHQALDALKPYEKSSESSVRSLAYNLLYSIGRSSKDTAIRSEAVGRLSVGCNDIDEATSTSVCKYLQYFKKADFSATSRTQIAEAFKSSPALIPKLARLVGFLEIKDLIPVLKEYTVNVSLSNRQKWEAWLALARMGDAAAMDYVLGQVKTIPVNDDVMYQFAPDLVYTRQHKALDYLIEILNSNKKDCTSSNPDNPAKIECGFRVMEYLAPVVEGFPLKIHASGDIDAKDYNEALKMVRQWFKDKRGKYVIKGEGF